MLPAKKELVANMSAEQQLVAIDREILLGLSVNLSPHKAAFEFFFKRNFLPLVTPCVWAVIKDTEEKSSDADARRQAQIIIQDTLDSLIVMPPITDTYNGVLDIHADALLAKNVLPRGDKVAALTLLEAIHLDATALLTTNPALRDAPPDKLKPALIDCGLHAIYIISPQQIVEYLESQAG